MNNKRSTGYALITGASAGIGEAIAHQFAKRNINVLLVALPGSGTFELAEKLRFSYGINCEAFEIDLTRGDAANEIYLWCKSKFEIQFVVNNAGFGNLKPFDETDQAVITSMLMLNNHAMVMLSRLLVPMLKKFSRSFILNVGSLASFIPIPNKCVYGASKSFVYSFSRALGLELRPFNIHVACLCPGATLTNEATRKRTEKVIVSKMFSQSADEVAGEGVRKLLAGKRLIIPGFHNRFTYYLWIVLPGFIAEAIIVSLFKNKKESAPKAVSLRPSFALIVR